MFPWASYGDYDRGMFQKQCDLWEIAYPFGSRHINVKTLAGAYRGLDHEVGMDKMLDLMHLKLEGRHHSAADDAYNIASILKQVLWKARYGLHYKEEA
jgi:inhibitor of KinA sporulation pathway (predicted exonuclease)